MTSVKCANSMVARNSSGVIGGGCASPPLFLFVYAAQPPAVSISVFPISSL